MYQTTRQIFDFQLCRKERTESAMVLFPQSLRREAWAAHRPDGAVNARCDLLAVERDENNGGHQVRPGGHRMAATGNTLSERLS